MRGKKNDPPPEKPKPTRKQRKLEKEEDPAKAEKLGAAKGTKDAYCTECHNWYDSTNQAQVNAHAH